MASRSDAGSWFLKNRCPIVPHKGNRAFGKRDCALNTARPTTNQLCCAAFCPSPWRMCHRCRELGHPYSEATLSIDALTGLCAEHGGVVRTPAELLQSLSSGDPLPEWPEVRPQPESENAGPRRDYYVPPAGQRAKVTVRVIRKIAPTPEPEPPGVVATNTAPAVLLDKGIVERQPEQTMTETSTELSLTRHEKSVIDAAIMMKMPTVGILAIFPGKEEQIQDYFDSLQSLP
jgi:hypothetical protein